MTSTEAAALPVYSGTDLGVTLSVEETAFKLWAPTAASAAVCLFATGTDEEPNARTLGCVPMRRSDSGVWSAVLPGRRIGVYYQYRLTFSDGRADLLADPYAHAAGANGLRSMVLDLAEAEPTGWQQDVRPDIPPAARCIWEAHVGDFSADARSGIPQKWRGKYLAFTVENSTLDGAGQFPTCLNYLKTLGISHVQLQPIFDFGRVDETRSGTYNWGYDPLNYNLPEGSYSTDPWHGAVRVKECRAMVQALHKAGFGVVMDVVYNHMFRTDHWLERSVPGYFNRRTADGSVTNGSGCGNDLASERAMYRKYMVDSVLFWATAYHIDGFRFDLMALHDAETMNAIRAALDALPGGQDILMYGEPWAGGATNLDPGARQADKGALDVLSDRIGFFCDATRDAIKGSSFDAAQPGYVNGGPYAGVRLLHAVNAWLDGEGGFRPKTAGQVVQYVSAHDNFTLWDKLCYTAGRTNDFRSLDESLLTENRMAAGIYLTCRGMPFLLAGEEFARTKNGNGNTWKGPQSVNALDWGRAQAFAPLTDWYRGLLALRRARPEFSGVQSSAAPILLAMPGWIIAFVLETGGSENGGELAVFYNPEREIQSVPLPAGKWRMLADGSRAGAELFGPTQQGSLLLAPKSVTILRAD